MKSFRIISLILLAIFVVSLPVSLLAGNISSEILSEEGLTDLIMDTVLSDEVLPQRIREMIWFQSWYSEGGMDARPRMLITGIRADQWRELLSIVFPEDTREELVSSFTGGLFSWLDGTEAYPDIVIDLTPTLANLNANMEPAASWAIHTLKVPACSDERIASLQAGEFSEDIMGLISCRPPEEFSDAVISHTAPVLAGMIRAAEPPETIDLSARLKAGIGEEEIITARIRIQRIRRLLPLAWALPVLLLGLALASVVRSRNDLVIWLRWPLFVSGLIGILAGGIISDPLLFLERMFMPPPAALPAPAAPIAMSILGSILHTAGSALQWQMGTILVIGSGMLLYSYQEPIIRILRQAGDLVRKFLILDKEGLENR